MVTPEVTFISFATARVGLPLMERDITVNTLSTYCQRSNSQMYRLSKYLRLLDAM